MYSEYPEKYVKTYRQAEKACSDALRRLDTGTAFSGGFSPLSLREEHTEARRKASRAYMIMVGAIKPLKKRNNHDQAK